jgi:hypothetical protein
MVLYRQTITATAKLYRSRHRASALRLPSQKARSWGQQSLPLQPWAFTPSVPKVLPGKILKKRRIAALPTLALCSRQFAVHDLFDLQASRPWATRPRRTSDRPLGSKARPRQSNSRGRREPVRRIQRVGDNPCVVQTLVRSKGIDVIGLRFFLWHDLKTDSPREYPARVVAASEVYEPYCCRVHALGPTLTTYPKTSPAARFESRPL